MAVGEGDVAVIDPAVANAWTSSTIDAKATLTAIDCRATAAGSVCDAGDDAGNVLVSTNPAAAAWSAPTRAAGLQGGAFAEISCPSISLCLGVGQGGEIASSAAPELPTSWGAGFPIYAAPGDADGLVLFTPTALACASVNLCVTFGTACRTASPEALTRSSSPRPSHRAGRATGPQSDPYNGVALNAISCPSSGFCLAGESSGDVLATTDPASSDPAAWSVDAVDPDASALSDGTPGIQALSCASSSFCAAADGIGHFLSSLHPSTASPAWTASTVTKRPGTAPTASLACPSSGFCALSFGSGRVFTSSDPGRSRPVWRSSVLPGAGSGELVSCPTARLCVTAASHDTVFVSTDPGRPRPAWRRTALARRSAGQIGFMGLACPSVRLCVALNDENRAFISTHPAAKKPAWRRFALPRGLVVVGLSCPRTSFCVAVESGGRVVATADPAARRPGWSRSDVPTAANPNGGQNPLTAISCADNSFCAVVDEAGDVTIGM